MRNKFIRDRRGQLVLILAIVMSMLILSVAFSIYQMTIRRSQLRYEPVKEIAMAITSDLNRALAKALKEASKRYNATQNYDESVSAGENIVRDWSSSIIAAYSPLGVRAFIYAPINGSGRTSIKIHFDWNQEVGVSEAYTDLDIDIEAYGFQGWRSRSSKSIWLRIFPETISINGSQNKAQLTFSLHENGKSIPSLTSDLLRIYSRVNESTWILAEIEDLRYLGGGNYSVVFSPINVNSFGIVVLAITPPDNIIVSARYIGVGFRGDDSNEETSEDYGDWTKLYLGRPENGTQKEIMILPLHLWSPEKSSLAHGKDTPVLNRGNPVIYVSSPTIPCNVPLSSLINISLYLRPNPAKEREINVTLLLLNSSSGEIIKMGSAISKVAEEGWYDFRIQRPENISAVKEGDRLILTISATFGRRDEGSIFIYCEKNGQTMSKIVLS